MAPAGAIAEAFGLGVLTAVLPCVLAQTVAAVGYIATRFRRTRQAILSAGCYMAGRTSVYVAIAMAVAGTALSSDRVALWLQRHVSQAMGLALVMAGLLILEIVRFRGPDLDPGPRLRGNIDRGNLMAAFGLGALMGLGLCPPVAGIYFLRVIPLALAHGDAVFVPLAFGLGTALPAAAGGLMVAMGVKSLARLLDRVQPFERWARWITGVVFILAGLYQSWQAFG